MHLSADHVVQLLVEDDSGVDLCLDHASGPSVVHDLLSGVLESVPLETVTDGCLPLSGECGSIDDASLHGSDLTGDHLEDVSDGHTGGDSVGVDDEVGGDSVCGEGHVALVDEPSDDSLLSEPGTELVTQLGDPLVPDLDTDEPGTVLGLGDHDGVDESVLSGPDGDGGLTPLLGGHELCIVVIQEPGGRGLSDEDIGSLDLGLGEHESILFVDEEVCLVSTTSDDLVLGQLELIHLSAGVVAGLCTVGPHEGGPSESSLDGALVHDESILDVVSVEGEDGDAEVLSCGPVAVSDVVHGLGLDHGDLGVLHQVSAGVGPDTVVGGGDSECLLTHSCSHGDTGGGVVLGVGNDSCSDSEDDHGVDLHVGVGLVDLAGHGELLAATGVDDLSVLVLGTDAPEDGISVFSDVHPVDVHGGQRTTATGTSLGNVVGLDEDGCVLLLLGIDPLDDALAEEVGPADLVVAHSLDVLPGECEPSVLDDEQGPPETALVGVDDDLAHLLIVTDVDLVGGESASPALPDLVDEPDCIGVDSDEVSVDVDTGSAAGLDGLDVELPEHPLDVGLGESLGDVDDQRCVLHETAVLTLRGLGRAESSPLGGVKVTSLEVGLGPGKG